MEVVGRVAEAILKCVVAMLASSVGDYPFSLNSLPPLMLRLLLSTFTFLLFFTVLLLSKNEKF